MALERNSSLKFLMKDQIEALLASITVSTYTVGDIVIQHGTKTNSGLWIVVNGALDCGDHGQTTLFKCVGDRYIQGSSTAIYNNDFTAA
jgi:signal-transduction protein with cAMP-binding, CBS, and nucleotidyltransferase domain